MTKRFPPGLRIEEVLVFETDYLRCTFAEVRIALDFAPDQGVLRQSYDALTRLDPEQAFQRFAFPAGGFAVLAERSLIDVVGDLEGLGDEGLSEAVEMTIWSAKMCWDDHLADNSLRDGGTFWSLAGDASGLVFLGEGWPHIVIVAFPDRGLAYYFGP